MKCGFKPAGPATWIIGGVFCASLAALSQNVYAESLPVKAYHVNIQLLAPGKPYDADWKVLCTLLAKSMAPASGSWGFGIFRSATCFLGSKIMAGPASIPAQDAWLLQLNVQGLQTSLSLFPPPSRLKTREEQIALGPQVQLLFPSSPELPGALKSAPFVQLAAAYLLDGLPFFSQVVGLNLKSFEAPTLPAPPSLLPSPPAQFDFLDLRQDTETGDVRVKVIKKSNVRAALASGNVWVGNQKGSQTLQPDLMARMKAELNRLQKVAVAAARKKQEEEQDALEQAELDKLEELAAEQEEEEDEGPPIPLSYGSEAWGGFWPNALFGSHAQKIDAGLQFEAARGVTNRFSMGLDFQKWQTTEATLSSLRGWAGWTLGVDGISFVNAIELGQALGASKINFQTRAPTKSGEKFSLQETLFPMYHVELGIIIVRSAFRFKPFAGYDTALGAASEWNIFSGGFDLSYAYLLLPFKERKLVNSVFLKYLLQQSFFRNAKFIKQDIGEIFESVRTNSVSLGARFTW